MAWGGTGWVIQAEGDDTRRRHEPSRREDRRIPGARRPGHVPAVPGHGAATAPRSTSPRSWSTRRRAPEPFQVTEVTYIADDFSPDVALLEIIGDGLPAPSSWPRPRRTMTTSSASSATRPSTPATTRETRSAYFRDLYDVKRYAPGRVMQPLGPPAAVLNHDCTSLGGNSGSPLIRLSDGKVVGLHLLRRVRRREQRGRREDAARAPRRQAALCRHARRRRRGEATDDGTHERGLFADRAGYDPSSWRRRRSRRRGLGCRRRWSRSWRETQRRDRRDNRTSSATRTSASSSSSAGVSR